jgi:gluconokinase
VKSTRDPVLAVDIGTSATKAVIFDGRGAILAQARQSYPMHAPRPEWTEQDPDVVLAAVQEAIRLAYQSRPAAMGVAAVAFSAQWYSIMPVAADGRPLAPYLTWSDRRSAAQADALRRDARADEIYRRTGCPIDAIYPLAKIAWLKSQEAGRRAARFLSIKEYVFHRLFGDYLVDWGMASATGLFDIRQKTWSAPALEAAGISARVLSQPVSPQSILTRWNPDVLRATGLPQGLPCVLGGGDGALASIGVGAVGRGVAAVNVGSSAAARCLVREPATDPKGRLWTYLVDEGWWVTGGIVSSGAVVYEWFLRQIGTGAKIGTERGPVVEPGDIHAAMNALAATVPPGADGVRFLPYLSGEQCPVWDPRTTGALVGLTLSHTRAHLARAVYEGITASIARIVDAIRDLFGPIEEIRVTGGLTAAPVWLRIAADMLGARVRVPESLEGSALGAAVMAWVALGMAHGLDAAAEVARARETIEPDPATEAFYRRHRREMQRVLDLLKSAPA